MFGYYYSLACGSDNTTGVLKQEVKDEKGVIVDGNEPMVQIEMD
jgi:hypothetical protein